MCAPWMLRPHSRTVHRIFYFLPNLGKKESFTSQSREKAPSRTKAFLPNMLNIYAPIPFLKKRALFYVHVHFPDLQRSTKLVVSHIFQRLASVKKYYFQFCCRNLNYFWLMYYSLLLETHEVSDGSIWWMPITQQARNPRLTPAPKDPPFNKSVSCLYSFLRRMLLVGASSKATRRCVRPHHRQLGFPSFG